MKLSKDNRNEKELNKIYIDGEVEISPDQSNEDGGSMSIMSSDNKDYSFHDNDGTDDEYNRNTNYIMNNQKDIESIQQIYQIRNNLMNFIPMSEFISRARKIINDSTDFSFRTLNAEKFINENRPVFIMKLDNPGKVYSIKNDSEQELDKYSDSVGKLLSDQIMSELGREMRRYLHGDKEFQDLISSHDEDITNLVLSNIYMVKIAGPRENNISLRLFV